MKRTSLMLTLILGLLIPSAIIVHSAKSTSKTITVPDDYITIQAAIDTAKSGDTIFVENGTYELAQGQTLVIDKSFSLIGENPDSTILIVHPSYVQQGIDNGVFPIYGYEYPIEAKADNITISGFNIKSDGGDIVAIGDGFQFTNNAANSRLNVYGRYENITKNNLSQGIVCYGSFNNIEGNQIAGWGIMIGSSSSTMIHNNVIANCLGISAVNQDTSPKTNNRIFNNLIENCSIGLSVSMIGASSNDTVYHNNFINNARQTDSGVPWLLDDGKEGNYWSDYVGNDTNRDGIGDIPYVIDANSRDNYPLMCPFDIENNKIVKPSDSSSEANSFLSLPTETIVVLVAFGIVAGVAAFALIYLKKRKS